jgi:hypothetical protein
MKRVRKSALYEWKVSIRQQLGMPMPKTVGIVLEEVSQPLPSMPTKERLADTGLIFSAVNWENWKWQN